MIKTLTTEFKGNARLEGLNFFISCDLLVKNVDANQRTNSFQSKYQIIPM